VTDLDQIKRRVEESAERHGASVDADRHIKAECDMCWLIDTVKELVSGDLLRRISLLDTEIHEAKREIDDLKTRRGRG
jgi:hypothetical protein